MISVPQSHYPIALDSDYTLFKVYNSTQSVLDKTLQANSTIIEIRPVAPNDPEIWPDNGFVTLPEELVYYDTVEKNENGKIFKLLRCLRGYEGIATNHSKGTPVYGNVVAEYHNQLALAIANIQSTIGDLIDAMSIGQNSTFASIADVDTEFSMNMASALTNIVNASPVFDDACPDVEFVFNVLSPTEAEFCIRIFGPFTSYRLDFGDGAYTTTEYSGTHTYAVGTMNPYVTVTSDKCCIVQQPNKSYADGMPFPTVESVNPLVVNIPELPEFPNFVAAKATCPGQLWNLPPLMIPNNCLECGSAISGTGGACSVTVSVTGGYSPSEISIIGCCPPSEISIIGCCPPSLISIVGCEIPSLISIIGCSSIPNIISIVGCCIPSQISLIGREIPSLITIVGCDSMPSIISVIAFNIPGEINIVGCNIPSVINIVGCNIPSVISFIGEFGPIPSFSPICFCDPPSFTPITFAPTPTISVDWGTPPTLSVIIGCSASSTPVPMSMGFGDVLDDGIPITMSNDLGIPTEIKIIAPKINDIKIIGPEKPLPKFIEILHSIPEKIHLIADDVPRSIKLDASDIPRKILVEMAPNFLSIIKLEAIGIPDSIQVTGFPKSIEVVHNIPKTIQLEMPENPVVRMEYSGPPIQLALPAEMAAALKEIMIAQPGK